MSYRQPRTAGPQRAGMQLSSAQLLGLVVCSAAALERPATAESLAASQPSVTAECDQATVPFPPTAGAATSIPSFTGDALPPDLMSNGSFYAHGHPETLISHGDVRARLCVSHPTAAAVIAQIPWRRRDYNATQKVRARMLSLPAFGSVAP